MAKNNDILPRTPLARPKSEIYTPKQDDEHPCPFHMGAPPRDFCLYPIKQIEVIEEKSKEFIKYA